MKKKWKKQIKNIRLNLELTATKMHGNYTRCRTDIDAQAKLILNLIENVEEINKRLDSMK